MTDDEGLLDKVLRTSQERRQAQDEAAVAATKPCPPDPTLDRLFRDFATQMKGRPTVAFVRLESYTEQTSRQVGGFLSRRTETVTTSRVRMHEVARGWKIGVGRRIKLQEGYEMGWHASEPVYGQHSLAVTTDGLPWFVVTQPGDIVIGSGELSYPVPEHVGPVYVGPPLGPSLRWTIIGVLKLNPLAFPGVQTQHYQPNPNSTGWAQVVGGGYEELPAYIASSMANIIGS